MTSRAQPTARVIAFPNALAELAARIRAEHEDATTAIRRGLEHAIRAGELLIEARDKVPHGQWLPWLAEHVAIPERTAQRYMRLARNRAKIEAANPSDLSDLTVDAALALLATPAPKVPPPGSVAQGLNAVGKPYSPSYDPNYRIRGPLTSIARLSKPQHFLWGAEASRTHDAALNGRAGDHAAAVGATRLDRWRARMRAAKERAASALADKRSAEVIADDLVQEFGLDLARKVARAVNRRVRLAAATPIAEAAE